MNMEIEYPDTLFTGPDIHWHHSDNQGGCFNGQQQACGFQQKSMEDVVPVHQSKIQY